MFAEYIEKPSSLNFEEYFDDIVGVTIPQGKKIEHVVMRVAPDRYPYIKNKPLHPSQHNNDKLYNITPLDLVKVEGSHLTFETVYRFDYAGGMKFGLRMFPQNDLLPHRMDFAYVRWIG
jgi:hypothetical protein